MDAVIQSKTMKAKWKDLRASNEEIQTQVNVGEVGVNEGIELRWS